MHPLLITQPLSLLVVANRTPLSRRENVRACPSKSVRRWLEFLDGRPLFGSSKTRGLALSILATPAVAPLIGLDWRIGALVALMAMIGDLLSSFLKRRMGLAPSDKAIGLDQIPRSPASPVGLRVFLASNTCRCDRRHGHLFFGELALSRALFILNIRNRPY